MNDSSRETLNAATRYCAVLGHPVRHSASPAMHNAAFQSLGMNWCYLAFDVDPSELKPALSGASALGMIGLNLTVPHKLLAMEFVEALDTSARRWGAVNTVRFEMECDGEWVPLVSVEPGRFGKIRSHGFNTDADAIIRSLQEDLGFDPAGKTILLLGAGGAGRVAALKLAESGCARLFLENRTARKAVELASEISGRFSGVHCAVGVPYEKVDLILNATSLGLKAEDPTPLPPKFSLAGVGAVYDMIYRPSATRLLNEAREAGCRTANGLGMLLHQGAKALEIWTGRPAPLPVMRTALERNIYGG